MSILQPCKGSASPAGPCSAGVRPAPRASHQAADPAAGIDFSTTQVVMHRKFWTFVVLSGSASVPPSRASTLISVRSSTTKRSEPSGSLTRPTGDDRWRSIPMLVAKQSAEKQPARREHPPHLLEHLRKRLFVASEVQDGAADDRVGRAVRPRQRAERGATNMVRRGNPDRALRPDGRTAAIAAASASTARTANPRRRRYGRLRRHRSRRRGRGGGDRIGHEAAH